MLLNHEGHDLFDRPVQAEAAHLQCMLSRLAHIYIYIAHIHISTYKQVHTERGERESVSHGRKGRIALMYRGKCSLIPHLYSVHQALPPSLLLQLRLLPLPLRAPRLPLGLTPLQARSPKRQTVATLFP